MAQDSVVVIGDVITDIIVWPKGPIAWGSDTLSDIRPVPGGSGPNQAAWLATAGVPTYFMGRVGANDLAQVEGELRDFGVEPILAGDPDLPTGMLVTLITKGGDRSFLTDRGANRHLARADLRDSVLDRAGFLHISGYSLFETGPRAAVLDYVAQARRMGIPITVDPSSAGYLRDIGPANFLAWTDGMHICLPNAEEATLLTGTPNPTAQLRTLTKRYEIVVIKQGEGGVIAGNAAGERWDHPAKKSKVIDTVGAGDAFFGRFIAAYFRGEPMAACLKDAVEAGTFSTTLIGGRPPRPNQAQP